MQMCCVLGIAGHVSNKNTLLWFTYHYNSVFQPGFHETSGFREWLPGVPPKQTEISWDEIRKHASTYVDLWL